MKNKETKKQSRWNVWKSGGRTINKVHIVWQGHKVWRNLPHVKTKRDILQICVAFSAVHTRSFKWKGLFIFLHKHLMHFSLLYFVPFLNYESVYLISSEGTVEISSQSGFQCPLLPLGSTSPENQFEMRLPLFLWMKSSGQIHSSKMARNKAMKKVIILIFLFC